MANMFADNQESVIVGAEAGNRCKSGRGCCAGCIQYRFHFAMLLCLSFSSITGEHRKHFVENMPPCYTSLIEMSIQNLNYLLKKIFFIDIFLRCAVLVNTDDLESMEKRFKTTGYMLETRQKDLPGEKKGSLEIINSGNGDHKENAHENI